MRQEKSLVKIDVPYIFQLNYEDEKAKEAVKLVLDSYKGTKAALNTLNLKAKGPVRGSNVYFRFAIGNAYREITKEDVRPINPRESEIASANDALIDPNSTYEDLGLIVYPKEGTNPKIGKYLREQVKDKVDLKQPFMITGLMDVLRDNNYENGLRLDVNELTEAYNVLILNEKTGRFDSNDPELQKTGFPSKLKGGDRTLYTSNNSVRGFFRSWGLDLYASSAGLAISSDAGRVHFIKNFSGGNLEELLKFKEQLK